MAHRSSTFLACIRPRFNHSTRKSLIIKTNNFKSKSNVGAQVEGIEHIGGGKMR